MVIPIFLFGHGLISILGLFLYLLPIIVAYRRRHPSLLGISLLTTFLGWTAIGWIVALIWAFSGPPRYTQPQQYPSANYPPRPYQTAACANCGTPVSTSQNYCPNCGARL